MGNREGVFPLWTFLFLILGMALHAPPAAAVESAARANASGSQAGTPLSDNQQQDDLTLVTATAAVSGSEGSGQATVTADALLGTVRFSLLSSGTFGTASILGSLLENVALSVPGAAPGERTPFFVRFGFSGTPGVVATGGYTLVISTDIRGANIESATPGPVTIEFDDGLFESPLRDPFSPLALVLQGAILGPGADLFIELAATANVFGDAALNFDSTLGFQLNLPPNVIAISSTSGGPPLYVTPLPAGLYLLASALLGLAGAIGGGYRRFGKVENGSVP